MANNNNNNNSSKAKDGINYTSSFLGAAGVGLQNYMATVQFIQNWMGSAYAISEAGKGMAHSFAVVLGGLPGVFVNYMLNVELLQDFFKRLKRLRERARLRAMEMHYQAQLDHLQQLRLDAQANLQQIDELAISLEAKKTAIDQLKDEIGEGFIAGLTGWKKVACWVGIGLFVVSGLLYGLMAVAVAPQGVLAILGIIAGALVTPIQTIQELEVWVNWLDPLENTTEQEGTTLAKGTGLALSILTVIVLSTLFTLGLASFLISFGVAALPALIAGVAVAFTIGAFTEFFFYAPYLMGFCSNVNETWQDFKKSKYPVMGGLIVGLNAVTNGVVAGFAIGLLIGVMVTAGAAVPPFGAILAVAIIAGVIAATASFMLGTKFWVRKFGVKTPPAVELSDDEVPQAHTLKHMKERLSGAPQPNKGMSSRSSLTTPLLRGESSATSPEVSPRQGGQGLFAQMLPSENNGGISQPTSHNRSMGRGYQSE